MKNTRLFSYFLIIAVTTAVFPQLETDPELLDFGFKTFNQGQAFTAVSVDNINKKVWAGTDKDGFYSLDLNAVQSGAQLTSFVSNNTNGPDLANLRINGIATDNLGNTWVAHSGTNFSEFQGGVEQIDNNLNVKHYLADRNALGFSFFERDGLGTRDVKSIAIDINNKVWVAQKSHNLTSGATFIVTPGTLSSKSSNEDLFVSKSTWWDPVTGNTRNISPELPYPAYSFNPKPNETPQTRNMQAVSADSTEVWVGAWLYAYINEADEEVVMPNRVLRYKLDGTYIPSGTAVNGGLTLEDMQLPNQGIINNIYRNNKKGTWVTLNRNDAGFSVYSPVTNTWTYMDPNNELVKRILPPNTRFNDNAIWGNRYGNVFMGTNNGLLVYDGRGAASSVASYTLYSKTNVIPGSPYTVVNENMSSNNIFGGASEENGTQWIATDNGIIRTNIGFIPLSQCELALTSIRNGNTLSNTCQDINLSDPRSVGNEHINFVEDQLDSRPETDPTFHRFIVKTIICSSGSSNASLCSIENIYKMFKKNSAFQAIIPKDLPKEVLGDDFLRELIKPENKHLINELLVKTNNTTEPIKELNEHIKGTGLEDFIIFGVENRGGMNILGGLITDAPDQRNSINFYTNLQISENEKQSSNNDQSINGEEYRLYNVQKGIDTRDIFVKNYENSRLIPDFINAGIKEEEDCIGIGLESIYYDPIIMFVDDKNYKMVNYTKEGHIFYPGKIVRTVKRDEDTGDIYVETEGIGFHFCSGEVGQLIAATNALVGPVVFKNVDLRLKKAFEELTSEN